LVGHAKNLNRPPQMKYQVRGEWGFKNPGRRSPLLVHGRAVRGIPDMKRAELALSLKSSLSKNSSRTEEVGSERTSITMGIKGPGR